MLDIKKKLFGYDPEVVESMFKELEDKVFNLRQEMFSSEKKPDAASVSVMGENTKLIDEIKQLKIDLSQKEIDIEGLKQYKNSVDGKSPNYDLIEKIYANAFESSKQITGDAKKGALDLADSIYSELNNQIVEASDMFNEIFSSKKAIEVLIDDSLAKFNSIKGVLGSFTDESIRISDFHNMIENTKKNIYVKVNGDASAFENEIEAVLKQKKTEENAEQTKPEITPVIEEVSEEISEETETVNIDLDALREMSVEAERAEIEKASQEEIPNEEISAEDESLDKILEKEYKKDNHFSLEALKVENPDLLTDENAKKFKSDEETVLTEELSFDPSESLHKMQESIKKELSEANEEKEPEADAEIEFSSPPKKVSIEQILKKYSNIKDN